MTDILSHPFARGFALVMASLREAIAYVAGRPALNEQPYRRARRPLAMPLAERLHRRLGKMMQKFNAVFAHVVAFGADPPQRAPRRKPAPRPDADAAQAPDVAQGSSQGSSPTVPGAARPDSPKRAPRLPGQAGWLRSLSSEIACYGGQLQYLVNQPDSLAMLRASPMLGRLIQPLCRMLGVVIPAEVAPPRPPKPPRPPRPPRVRKRRWNPPRRADLHFILRMGKPIAEG